MVNSKEFCTALTKNRDVHIAPAAAYTSTFTQCTRDGGSHSMDMKSGTWWGYAKSRGEVVLTQAPSLN